MGAGFETQIYMDYKNGYITKTEAIARLKEHGYSIDKFLKWI